MKISTKRGDTGLTSTISGERVPKSHIITEAVGAVDEANSLLGLARASVTDRRIKRIILQIQRHLFTIGAELSSANSGKKPGKTITEVDLLWAERLVEDMEEALSLPPGFVAFGQEISSSHLDVARTAIRKVERITVKMFENKMINNNYLLKYLNRLSDLIFLLAAYEEKTETERRGISLSNLRTEIRNPIFKKVFLLGTIIIVLLTITIIAILIFHDPSPDIPAEMIKHMENMNH